MSDNMCFRCRVNGEINADCEHPCKDGLPPKTAEERISELENALCCLAQVVESLAASMKGLTIQSMLLQKRVVSLSETIRPISEVRYGM